MPLVPEASRLWNDQAQFDYISPFVKIWAAFNSWYRHHSGSWKDSDGLRYVCGEDNAIKNIALPRIRNTNDQAMEFKRLIGELHDSLSEYDINKRREDGTLEVISFRSVTLQKWNGAPSRAEVQRVKYRVEKTNRVWISTIVGKNGQEQFRFEQDEWSITELDQLQRFRNLPGNKAPTLRQVYSKANPRPLVNLLEGDADELQIGNHAFRCSADELFTALVFTLYDLRNCLLHGELKPNDRALSSYGPAFRILKSFMEFAQHTP